MSGAGYSAGCHVTGGPGRGQSAGMSTATLVGRIRLQLDPDQQQQPLVATRILAQHDHDADAGVDHDDHDTDDAPARHHDQYDAWWLRQHRPFVVELQLTAHATRCL